MFTKKGGTMLDFIKDLNSNILWGWPTILLLLFTGVAFSIMLKFIQVRKMGLAFKETFGFLFDKNKKELKKGEVSSFQSLATAIAAQVGTGNLAGVATAIVSGGPGAIFWMWLSGFFGMGTIYAEAVVSQHFVEVIDGEKVGGPAYYISKGLKHKGLAKFLAGFFAVAIVFALGFMGNMVQTNSISDAAHAAFGVPKIAVGIVVAILVLLVVAGGVSRITSVTEKLVPFMAIFYILGSLVILGINVDKIIPALASIFSTAFSTTSILGGAMGVSVKMAFRYGVARGLFSNEAGMGSTPHAHALAKVDHPSQQGLTATLGVLIDTGIVCTMTALVVLTTGAFGTKVVVDGKEVFMTGGRLTQEAFFLGFGDLGLKFISICLFFFAFSTLIGWYFFGETNIKYLFGKAGVWPYRLLVVACIVVGASLKVDIVWELADALNALMVYPNLIGLIALFGLVYKINKDFENNFLKGQKSEYANKK